MSAKVYVLVFLLVVICVGANRVDYFVDLITEGRRNSSQYEPPEDASIFEGDGENSGKTPYQEYDFIIIGAGSAGSVLANRLSERSDWEILVIEAGDFENNFTGIPAMRYSTEFSDYNWGYKSVPQKYACLGLVNSSCPIPRGKGVGGTTLLNGLVYDRPNPQDFQRWEAEGNPGWSYDEVLPYMVKSEKSNLPDGDTGYHGFKGFLHVEYRTPQSPLLKTFLEANVELGHDIIDYNGKHQLGVSQVQHNTVFGVRQTNAKAFIKPIVHRKNLTLLVKSYVTRILVDSTQMLAKAVEFVHNNKRYSAFARKEIVVTAGAVNTPCILQHSGIGPKKLLDKLQIPIVVDLPVGRHLSVQPTFHGLYFDTVYSEAPRTLKGHVKEYLQGFGPLTVPGNNQGVGWYQTPIARYPPAPDLQITLITPNSSNELTPKVLNLNEDSTDALFGDSEPNKEFSLEITALQPLSEGKVAIKSKDPFKYPVIDPKLLFNNLDVDTIYQGILKSFDLVNTEPFQHLSVRYTPKPLPACDSYEFLSKYYWYCAIRQLTMGNGNLGGTCRMGKDKEKSVVDHRLRVHNVKNLRVADASIFPFPLSADYTTAAILVAERASDFIKQEKGSVLSRRFNQEPHRPLSNFIFK